MQKSWTAHERVNWSQGALMHTYTFSWPPSSLRGSEKTYVKILKLFLFCFNFYLLFIFYYFYYYKYIRRESPRSPSRGGKSLVKNTVGFLWKNDCQAGKKTKGWKGRNTIRPRTLLVSSAHGTGLALECWGSNKACFPVWGWGSAPTNL